MRTRQTINYLIMSLAAITPFFIGFEYTVNENGIFYMPVIASETHIEVEKALFVVIGIFMFLRISKNFPRKLTKSARIVSLAAGVFFAFCVQLGKSFELLDSWNYVFGSLPCFIASLIMICGYAILFYRLICLILYFAENYEKITASSTAISGFEKRLNGFLSKNTLFKLHCGLLICWLPYILIYFPAAFHYDSGNMLWRFFTDTPNNHDPILQTLFLGGFVTFVHRLTGSYNTAVFFSHFCNIFTAVLSSQPFSSTFTKKAAI